jgi:hypothetical protein
MIETYISNIFDGQSKAYIYLWVSKTHKVVYVGMTNGYTGTLGRAGAHVDKNGTLRKRFEEYRGYQINAVSDFRLFSFLLPNNYQYISVEKSYREAIEYLVQKELILIRGDMNPNFDVISWVRESPRTNNSEVISIAKAIVSEFTSNY